MKQMIVIIFLIIPIAYGMEEQEPNKSTFTPGHRRNSSASINDPALKQLIEKSETLPPPNITHQSSELPNLPLDSVSLHLQIEQLNQQKKELEEEKQNLTKENTTLKEEIVQLKQPNKFIRLYVTTTLSYMIGTLAYFTYPWWSTHIKSTLPHLLYYKK